MTTRISPEILRDIAECEKRPFYWTKVHDDPKLSAPSGWYQWQGSGLVHLGGTLPVGAQEENTCPKCGTVMCEKFDERPGPNPLVTLAVPNGQFSCMKCGYDPANGMSTIGGEGHGKG